MVAAAKVALDVNVALVGTVKYVDLYPEKPNPKEEGKVLPAQWALNGAWEWTAPDGQHFQVEGKVYIDAYQLAASPVMLGLVEQSGTWDDGNPRYKWTYKAPVRVLKTERDKKRHVTISRLTDAAPTAAGAATALPQSGYEQARARISAAPVSSVATPTPVPHSSTPKATAAAVFGDPWSDLERQYERARVIACRVWGDNYDPQALVAATATVFIEGNKRGLASPVIAEAASFAGVPPALQQQDDGLPW